MSYFNISKKENRIKVFDKFGGHCAYCGVNVSFGDFQIDHLVPLKRSKQGYERDYSFENCMPSCRQCNASKSDFDLERWRSELELKVKRLNKYYSIYRICKSFGLIKEYSGRVQFYFEIHYNG